MSADRPSVIWHAPAQDRPTLSVDGEVVHSFAVPPSREVPAAPRNPQPAEQREITPSRIAPGRLEARCVGPHGAAFDD